MKPPSCRVLRKVVFDQGDNSFAIMTIAVGLTIDCIHVKNHKDVNVGDQIDLRPEFLTGGIITGIMEFAAELEKYGQLQEQGRSYEVNPEVDGYRSVYLYRIFDLMKRIGSFDLQVLPGGAIFLPAHVGSDPQDLLMVGALISTYNWKFQHESAALAGLSLKTNQEHGRLKAAVEKKRQSGRAANQILDAAQKVLNEKPHLIANTLGLAKEISKLPERPLRADGAPLGVSSIRGYISKLRNSEKLPKSP